MSDPASDVGGMIRAGAWVAAGAVPVAVACGLWLRAKSISLCPRWRLPRFVWPGQIILAVFVLSFLLPPVLAPIADATGVYSRLYPSGFPPQPESASEDDARNLAGTLKMMWARLAVLPAVLTAAVAMSRFDSRQRLRNLPRSVTLGTLGFLTFGAITFGLNVMVEITFRLLGGTPDEHVLSKLGRTGDGYGGVLFVLSACVVAPVLEEFTFRGLLVPWAGGRRYRPWLLMAWASVVVVLVTRQPVIPLVFVAVLAAAQPLVRWPGKRTGRAIWSSSVLFAAVHSAVWPSPIPLFVLALGLGYLTARTRSWLPAAIAHGLFNLVSTLFVFSRG